MESWEVLKHAIPDGMCKAVALRVHRTPDQVLRWRRQPPSPRDPLSTGQRSSLHGVKLLIAGVFFVHPVGAALIAQDVWSHYHQLRNGRSLATPWDRRQHAAETLREAVEAVNCLNLDAADDQTIIEIVEARDAFDQALVNLRAGQTGSSQRREKGRFHVEGRAS